MATKLYVGNLPYSMTDDQMREIFAAAGAVNSASVLIDRQTGRSRGFGFVEMADDAGASAAIETLNGKEIDGRKLVVNEARPMTERAPRTGGFGGGGRGGFGGGSGGNRGGYGGGNRDY